MGSVTRGRKETSVRLHTANSLDAVVQRRARGVHQHFPRLGPARRSLLVPPPPLRFSMPAFLEAGPDAHDRTPRAARHDEGVDFPVELVAYLGTGGGVVRRDVREVLELVHEGRFYQPRGPLAVQLGTPQPFSLIVGRLGARGGGGAPLLSASRTMLRAARSFPVPPGLPLSILRYTETPPGRREETVGRRTRGVFPMRDS